LKDAKFLNGKVKLLLDDGYTTVLAEINRGGAITNQRGYGNVFSLLQGDQLISGGPGNRIYYSGRRQYALMGFMKTEDDGSIPCMETQSQLVTQNVSSFFRTGNIQFNLIISNFSFAFEDIGGGIGRSPYNFDATTDCIVTCCGNIRSDTTYREFCNQPSYRLPDNSVVKETGLYYVNVKNTNNCDSIAYYDLKFLYKPTVDLGADTCFTNQLPILLKADSGYTNYTWMGVNTTSHTYTATTPGKYYVSIANQCGTGVDEIEIFEDCDYTVYMPSGFTPNNDGVNDYYDYPAQNKNRFISIRIFNRVGQQIYQATAAGRGWNGKYKGMEQPAGVYVYVLQLMTLDGRKVFKKGTFVYVR